VFHGVIDSTVVPTVSAETPGRVVVRALIDQALNVFREQGVHVPAVDCLSSPAALRFSP
jgi:hypothetical protein